MLPPVVIIFPFLMMYRFLGLLDNPWSLALAYTLFNLPLAVWIMRDAFRAVPVEIEESALVDGCSRLSVFWKVALPLAAPGLVASFIICLIFAWNEFVFALILTRTEVLTFPVLVTHYYGAQSTFWSKIAALSVLGTLPVFFAVATLQRFLVRGITMGAVKG